MFLLKELPEKKFLKKLAKESKGIDPNSAAFALQLLKTASDAFLSIDKFFTARDLSQGRFLALMVLNSAGEGGMYPYGIADSMGVSRATASGLIKGLEKSGDVVSSQAETDGRMKKIMLTQAGREKIEKFIPQYYAFISSFAAGHDKKELKQFTEFLAMINTAQEETD